MYILLYILSLMTNGVFCNLGKPAEQDLNMIFGESHRLNGSIRISLYYSVSCLPLARSSDNGGV